MALNNYFKPDKRRYGGTTVNVVDLMSKAKVEKKRERRHTIIITTATLFILAFFALIISL